MAPETNQQISVMAGRDALPRRNGELVFHDDWERRVFALAVALCEQGQYPWDDFREQLIASIANTQDSAEDPDPKAPGYYEHWLAALEQTLANNGIIQSEAINSD